MRWRYSCLIVPLAMAALEACTPAPSSAVKTPAPVTRSSPAPQGPNEAAAQTINNAVFTAPSSATAGVAAPSAASKLPDPVIIKAEVLLDRARFSPGVIDGLLGENFRNALTAFEQAHGLPTDGRLGYAVWSSLNQSDTAPVAGVYTITAQDVAGPFSAKIPENFVLMAQQKASGYTSVSEMLAERFHMDEDLLKFLNPKADFTKAGTPVLVATPGDIALPALVKTIDVVKADNSVRAYDADHNLLAVFPATIGSTERPSPSGTYKVRGVARNPVYVYDPAKLTFGPRSHGKLQIPPGPNNPVGVVWIALSRPTFGIHGAPEPKDIGKTASHGCVRLTNWDAMELAAAVRPGVVVTFVNE